jgi:putative cardiolipin synthase
MPGTRYLGRIIVSALFAALMAGCASVPEAVDRQVSTAFPASVETVLGRVVDEAARAHPQQSGFALLTGGEQALTARHDLTMLAERGIDIQYYIWEGDTSGRLMAASLLAAAERGVRVRVLIDDIHTKGRDFNIAALDAHPGIEIRTFNPFANREARNWNLVTDFARLNHRMHNKAFIVDGAVAVVGGRNIGDDYFGLNAASNFRDIDVLAAGPVAAGISASFDEYWNSEWAFPIGALAGEVPSPERAAGIRDELSSWARSLRDFPYRLSRTPAEAGDALRSALGPLSWGKATVVYDAPAKASGSGEQGVAEGLRPEIAALRKELLIEVAYFIATDDGVKLLGDLVDRGARVRILTNSLATNDLVPGHAGYSRYREDLLRRGVELYEFRPAAAAPRTNWSPLAATSKASLHSKAMVLDREKVFIGSFNLNPRSVELNTEIGVIVDSVELAQQVRDFMDVGTTPANAWQLHLATETGRSEQLVWSARDDSGAPVIHDTDPEVSNWRRFTAWFIALLPIEREL